MSELLLNQLLFDIGKAWTEIPGLYKSGHETASSPRIDLQSVTLTFSDQLAFASPIPSTFSSLWHTIRNIHSSVKAVVHELSSKTSLNIYTFPWPPRLRSSNDLRRQHPKHVNLSSAGNTALSRGDELLHSGSQHVSLPASLVVEDAEDTEGAGARPSDSVPVGRTGFTSYILFKTLRWSKLTSWTQHRERFL